MHIGSLAQVSESSSQTGIIQRVKPPPPPPRDVVLAKFLADARRPNETIPIRSTFVQRTVQGKPTGGPMSDIARRGAKHTLDQYLLLHARASGGDFSVTLDSTVWARLLGLPEDAAGCRTVQRGWKTLKGAGLVDTQRSGRLLRVTLLSEDGSGSLYRHPGGSGDTYIQLPFAYFERGYDKLLTPAGKTVLLIAMSLLDWFPLPYDRAGEWYGLGASTVERGLRDLRRNDLLVVNFGWKAAELSRIGWTQELRYCLGPPFGPKGKAAKGTPTELLPEPKRVNPSRQAGSTRRRTKRVKPGAGKSEGGSPAGARSKPGPRKG